jgi:hypothetical protein
MNTADPVLAAVHAALRERAAVVLAQPSGQPVPSPCVSLCQMQSDTGWCWGCRRSLNEIANWSSLGTHGQRAVWRAISVRLGHAVVATGAT